MRVSLGESVGEGEVFEVSVRGAVCLVRCITMRGMHGESMGYSLYGVRCEFFFLFRKRVFFLGL